VSPPSTTTVESRRVEVLVIGAGVLGLCVAAELTLRGHEVLVVDPGGVNASAVAAGMIAPALESAIEQETPERAALLRRAAALWPAFAAATGVRLYEDGAVWRGAGIDEIADSVVMLGFGARRDGDVLHIDGEFRVEAEAALGVLAKVPATPPLRAGARSLRRDGDLWRVSLDHGEITARSVVLATGAATPLAGLPASVAARIAGIRPIGGLIGRTSAAFGPGVVRGRGAYAATGPDGTTIGATMDFDERTPVADAARGEALLNALAGFSGVQVAGDQVEWRAGVRGATADGLPLAGATEVPGLYLALAPRRNGWLLGPLVGKATADAVEGATPGPDAAALDPLRPL
jgi:glycine oxidase